MDLFHSVSNLVFQELVEPRSSRVTTRTDLVVVTSILLVSVHLIMRNLCEKPLMTGPPTTTSRHHLKWTG